MTGQMTVRFEKTSGQDVLARTLSEEDFFVTTDGRVFSSFRVCAGGPNGGKVFAFPVPDDGRFAFRGECQEVGANETVRKVNPGSLKIIIVQ